MGYYSGYSTKREMMTELLREWSSSNVESKCLAYCWRGNAFSGVLWSAWRQTFADGRIQDFIKCDKCDCTGNRVWGYKPMDESMHPYFYSCPLSYLELTQQYAPTDDNSKTWRAMVREYHANKGLKRAN